MARHDDIVATLAALSGPPRAWRTQRDLDLRDHRRVRRDIDPATQAAAPPAGRGAERLATLEAAERRPAAPPISSRWRHTAPAACATRRLTDPAQQFQRIEASCPSAGRVRRDYAGAPARRPAAVAHHGTDTTCCSSSTTTAGMSFINSLFNAFGFDHPRGEGAASSFHCRRTSFRIDPKPLNRLAPRQRPDGHPIIHGVVGEGGAVP